MGSSVDFDAEVDWNYFLYNVIRTYNQLFTESCVDFLLIESQETNLQKTAVSPLLMHWRYHSITRSRWIEMSSFSWVSNNEMVQGIYNVLVT